ncbi:MAG TPA: hypothetical protein VG122_16625 [Gemmata sp.]|jgi:hypothetical protein|nr:hypothetical protein [Gemmata sp.]
MTSKKLKAKLADLRRMLTRQFPTTRQLDEWSVGFDWVAGTIPFVCYAEINPEMQGFVFRAIWQLPFAPDRRDVAAEYLHRVNYPVPVGGWAIDLDTGDVRWKSGLYFGDGDLTNELMFEVINSSFALIRQHVIGLVKLSNGEPLAAALAVVGEDPGEGVIAG